MEKIAGRNIHQLRALHNLAVEQTLRVLDVERNALARPVRRDTEIEAALQARPALLLDRFRVVARDRRESGDAAEGVSHCVC